MAGQIRLFWAGEGADLVVLASPLLAAEVTATEVADLCPGWRVTAVELPGIGGSARYPVEGADRLARALADAIGEAGIGACVLVGLDLAAVLAERVAVRLSPRAEAVAIGRERARAWAGQGIAPPDLRPTTSGTHLAALWTFLRDRHVMEPGDPTQASGEGDPIPDAAALDRTFVAAATSPTDFAALWTTLLAEAAPGPGPDRLDQLPQSLAGVARPTAGRPGVLPRPHPAPPGIPWHDVVETARGRMHLRRVQGGAGRPVLVLPTGGGSSAQFARVVSGLARGRDVFSLDYRGNGLSGLPDAPVTIATLAADAASLLDAMILDVVDLWGSHTGALVALELAVTHPERVGRIVLEGPVFLTAQAQGDILAHYFPPLEPDPWGRHVAQAFHWRRDMFLFWPWYRAEREAVRRLGLPTPQHLHDYTIGILESGRTYDGAYRAAFSYDTRARMPLLTRPALVCAGPNDMLIDGLAETERLAVPGVTVRTTPTTVWWPDPGPVAAAETLALYDAFLRG